MDSPPTQSSSMPDQAADARILLVDDDPDMRALLSRHLSRDGFRVDSVGDGNGLDERLAAQRPDLIILDLMLPGADGLSLAKQIRARSNLPIIMISARDDEVDRIVGLEIGADDYLSKPFNPRELTARVRAVLRRHYSTPDATAYPLRFGPYELAPDCRSLTRHGESIAMTNGELELLGVLASHPNQVLHRDRLLDLLKGPDRAPFDRSIDVQVARLRRKIEDDSRRPRYIVTVWGKGYKFIPDAQH